MSKEITTNDWLLDKIKTMSSEQLQKVVVNLLPQVDSFYLDRLYVVQKYKDLDSCKMSIEEFLNYQKDIDKHNENSKNKNFVIYKIERMQDDNDMIVYRYGIYNLAKEDFFGKMSRKSWGWYFTIYFKDGYLLYSSYQGTQWDGDLYTEFKSPTYIKDSLDKTFRKKQETKTPS